MSETIAGFYRPLPTGGIHPGKKRLNDIGASTQPGLRDALIQALIAPPVAHTDPNAHDSVMLLQRYDQVAQ